MVISDDEVLEESFPGGMSLDITAGIRPALWFESMTGRFPQDDNQWMLPCLGALINPPRHVAITVIVVGRGCREKLYVVMGRDSFRCVDGRPEFDSGCLGVR